MGLWDAASGSFSEAVEVHGPTAQWKNQPLQFKAFSIWSCCLFPLWPAHLCQLQSTPRPGHSLGQVQRRLIVPQGLFSFVFLLLLVVVFIPCIIFHGLFWVQETAAHVWLSYSGCGTKSVKDLRKSTVLQYVLRNTQKILFCLRLLFPEALRKFFLLPSCRLHAIFLRFLCNYIFHIVAFVYGVFSITWFEYRFFQTSLLILLCWSFYARFLKLVICVNVFCARFLRILIRGSHSYCDTLFFIIADFYSFCIGACNSVLAMCSYPYFF